MRVDAIEAKIYVEGVLLPGRAWGSFECTSRRKGAPVGSIVIPALPGIRQEDWARARVHVFWSDLEIRGRSVDWPILFEGEVVGSSFSKSPGSRNIVFSLMGPEVYWDQCKLYFYNFNTQVDGQNGSNLDVVNVNRKTFFFGNQSVSLEGGGPGLNLENTILAKMTEFPDRPLTSMIRRVIKDTVGGTNFFFSQANKVLGLDKRFALPRDDNVSLLYANQQLFFSQIEGNVAAREGAVAIGDVLRDSLSLLRYSWISNPQPRFTSGGDQYRLRVDQERARLAEDVSLRVVERLGTSADELGINESTTDEVLQLIAAENTQSLESVANDPGRAHTLEVVDFELFEDPSTTSADIAERNRQRIGETFAFLRTIRDELRRLAQPATEVDQNPLFPADEDQPEDRLAQFLLMPDTDYALPPACNVIFPNESASYGMNRDHLSEPTRSLLSVPIVTNGIQKVYFAPESLIDSRIPAQVIAPVSQTGTYPPVFGGPLSLPRVSSRFGFRRTPSGLAAARSVDEKGIEPHGGMDFAVPENTQVFAYDDGEVTHAGPQDKNNLAKGAGIYIDIKHKNGMITRYFHLNSVSVGVGNSVRAGQPIALSGNTGRSSGPHLHFEMKIAGQKVDPEPFVNAAIDGVINAASNAGVDQSIEVEETSMAAAIEDNTERFEDFKYLTPEEEVLGIVPIFDTSMDRVSAAFERDAGTSSDDAAATLDTYMSQYALASFQRQKYASRSASNVPMPFSPRIACAFPALIVDPIRSYIAQIESVTHRISVQGGAEASTMVSLSQPRFWDEGDPFYWRNGAARYKSGSSISSVPDAEFARFPSFYLPTLIGTNSYEADPTAANTREVFGGAIRNRPVDELYQSLLGVNAIPYFYDERESQATGAVVAFNKAIDGVNDDGSKNLNTIVGYYENLRSQNHELAQQFVQNYTRRLGASESEVMVDFLGATAGKGGYTGGPFRPAIRTVIEQYVQQLLGSRVFRG